MGKQKKKDFDWTGVTFKQCLLKIAYYGTNYHGIAFQEGTRTVEGALFDALIKVRLIRSREECKFTRCGRTDRGVHAAGNAVSLLLRAGDLPYVQMLNKALPDDVRVLGWREVPPDFSARFSCLCRIYKYFFVQKEGLDLELLNTAAQKLVGVHDFRNFCKMDVEATTNFERNILSFKVEPLDDGNVVCTITGYAFLYHQIRCFMAILFLVAEGLEDPSIVDHLLDIEKCPRKPQYEIADPAGLVLYDCLFEGIHFDDEPKPLIATEPLHRKRQEMLVQRAVLSCLAGPEPEESDIPAKSYTPLLKRATCPSLEEKKELLEDRNKRREVKKARVCVDIVDGEKRKTMEQKACVKQ